jgi:hypothetical protein
VWKVSSKNVTNLSDDVFDRPSMSTGSPRASKRRAKRYLRVGVVAVSAAVGPVWVAFHERLIRPESCSSITR